MDFKLPTGKASYTEDELHRILIDDLSQDLMLLNSYGGGINISHHMLIAYNMDNIVLGGGIRYEVTGPYDPTSDGDGSDFDPGDQLLVLGNVVWIFSDD